VHPLGADQKFNLRITKENITLSQQTFMEDDNITITATITNNGDRYATSFVVKIFVDEDQLGSDKQFTTLKIGGTVTVEEVWQAVEGTHKITVAVLPFDTDLEADTTDNSAELTLTVEMKPTDIKDKPTVSDEDEKEGLSTSSMLMIIVVVIIIAAVLGFLISKRKKKEEAQTMEQFTSYPPGYPQEPYMAPGMQQPPESAQPGYAPDQYQSSEAEGVGMPLSEEPVEPQPPSEIEDIPSVAGEVPTDQMLAEHGDQGPLQVTKPLTPQETPSGEDAAAPEEPPAQLPEETTPPPPAEQPPAPEQPPAQPEQQMTACPTCGDPIAFYATPCPHCRTELNWN
jgi:hypothetical protein